MYNCKRFITSEFRLKFINSVAFKHHSISSLCCIFISFSRSPVWIFNCVLNWFLMIFSFLIMQFVENILWRMFWNTVWQTLTYLSASKYLSRWNRNCNGCCPFTTHKSVFDFIPKYSNPTFKFILFTITLRTGLELIRHND